MGKDIDEILTSNQLLIILDWDYNASDFDPQKNVK